MSKKVDLQKILLDNGIRMTDAANRAIIRAMKEACRQALELATENAELESFDFVEPWMIEPFNMTQDDYGNIHAIDKKSILDTINQIK